MNRTVFRYVWPVLFTAAIMGLCILLNRWLGIRISYLALYLSATLSAILGGLVPGLLAVVVGTLAAYFFVPPLHNPAVAGTGHALMLALDVAVAVALVVLADRQRRAASKAAEGGRMLEAVMESIPAGLTLAEAPDGKVRMISRHGAELLGGTRESFGNKTIGDYISAIYHPDGETPARVDELPQTWAIQRGEVTKDEEWVIKRPDGGASVVLGRAAPIRDGKGRITGAVAAWCDITERKRLEERLHDRAKLESLGVLAGGIAHDFNNLLTVVLGHASLQMNDLPEGSKAWESAQEISKAAERATRLSRQMLAYSGHGRFLAQPLNLSAYIRSLAPKIESSISKSVQLKLDLAIDLPTIEADASQMQELISNLVWNGVEAIGPGAGWVTIATCLLSVDKPYIHAPLVREEIQPGTYVTLEISDTGAGMDKETVSRMFDPFFTTKFMGRGLGLAAVQGIVHGHKGAILVYSAPGHGTTISTLFPVAVPTPAGTVPAKPGPVSRPKRVGKLFPESLSKTCTRRPE